MGESSSEERYDTAIAFDAYPISSDISMLVNVRRIDLQKMEAMTIEHKYPRLQGKLHLSEKTMRIVDRMAVEPFNPAEIIRDLEESPTFFQGNDIPQPVESFDDLVEKTHREYEKYGIDFPEIAQEVHNALFEVIDALDITDDQKTILHEAIEQSPLEYTYKTPSAAWRATDHTTINVLGPYYDAVEITNLLQVPLTASAIKAMVAVHIAHERGHIIDFAAHRFTLESQYFSNFIQEPNTEFPMIPVEEERLSLPTVHSERFAEYFQYACTKRMGLTQEIQEDWVRLRVSRILRILKRIPPLHISKFVQEAIHYDNPSQGLQDLVEDFKGILSGHAIAQAYPYEKKDIEQMIAAVQRISDKQRLSVSQRYYGTADGPPEILGGVEKILADPIWDNVLEGKADGTKDQIDENK